MADKHTFDIVAKVDLQELDNALNQALREINNRYDLKDTNSTIDYSDKEHHLKFESAGDYQLKAIKDIFHQKLIQRDISVKVLDYQTVEAASGERLRQIAKLQQGIPQDKAKEIVKEIKQSGLKVQPQITGDSLRVGGKKRDDLQAIISLLRQKDFDIHMSFTNFK